MKNRSQAIVVGNDLSNVDGRGCVVVGLDAGRQPAGTLTVAADEAVRRGLTLAVVTVLRQRMDPGLSLPQTLREQHWAEAIAVQELHAAAASVRASHPRLSVTTYCLGASEAAADREPLNTAEIVVVGTHGRRGHQAVIRTSTGGLLLRGSRCPVLVIPADQPVPTAAGRGARALVLVGVGEHPADVAVVRTGYAEAVSRGCGVLLVHAYALRLGEIPDQGRDRSRDMLAELVALAPPGLPVSVLVTEGEPVAALSRLAARSALLVIGGRTGPRSRRSGPSVSATLLEALPCPVLAVPRQLTAGPAGPLTGLALVQAVPAPN